MGLPLSQKVPQVLHTHVPGQLSQTELMNKSKPELDSNLVPPAKHYQSPQLMGASAGVQPQASHKLISAAQAGCTAMPGEAFPRLRDGNISQRSAG